MNTQIIAFQYHIITPDVLPIRLQINLVVYKEYGHRIGRELLILLLPWSPGIIPPPFRRRNSLQSRAGGLQTGVRVNRGKGKKVGKQTIYRFGRMRSEERRVGKGGVSKGRVRWSQD